ncbi:MAG: hypothetical protein KDD67_09730 [Ignavibacteriae bacterium]|nr:hypothetical protein [Ignavibacteriota bacterium]
MTNYRLAQGVVRNRREPILLAWSLLLLLLGLPLLLSSCTFHPTTKYKAVTKLPKNNYLNPIFYRSTDLQALVSSQSSWYKSGGECNFYIDFTLSDTPSVIIYDLRATMTLFYGGEEEGKNVAFTLAPDTLVYLPRLLSVQSATEQPSGITTVEESDSVRHSLFRIHRSWRERYNLEYWIRCNEGEACNSPRRVVLNISFSRPDSTNHLVEFNQQIEFKRVKGLRAQFLRDC